MAHTELFETKNARYVLIFGVHEGWETEESPVKPDALVIESGLVKPQDLLEVFFRPQNHKLVEQTDAAKGEIWLTDAPPSTASVKRNERGVSARKWIAGLLGFASVAIPAGVVATIKRKRAAAQKKKVKKQRKMKQEPTEPLLSRRAFMTALTVGGIGFFGWRRFLNADLKARAHNETITNKRYWNAMTKYYELESGKGMIAIRNAASAQKTDDFLAPRLRKKLGRKPTIVMAWGLAHYGIKELLLDKKTRLRMLQENPLEKHLGDGYQSSFQLRIEKRRNEDVYDFKLDQIPNTLHVKEESPAQLRRPLRRGEAIARKPTKKIPKPVTEFTGSIARTPKTPRGDQRRKELQKRLKHRRA
jgi:hypothetical protein